MLYPFTILYSGGLCGSEVKSSSCALVQREAVSAFSWDIDSRFRVVRPGSM